MNAQPSATQYNQRAIELRAAGRAGEALAVFAEGVERFPTMAALRANYAHALYESGATQLAVEQYERLLHDDQAALAARFALYELLQILGRRDEALEYQLQALEQQALFSTHASNERRRLLLLCTPGDLQANIPVDFIIDRQTTTVHRFYLLNEQQVAAAVMPPFDVIWNVIAESPHNRPALDLAQQFIDAHSDRAVLNLPHRVLGTSRESLQHTLAQSGAYVAPVARVSRLTLESSSIPYGYPAIARPIGSHAGKGLARISSNDDFGDYLRSVRSEEYYVSPFVDYASADGYFRKYRIIFVDGTPYPCHLAISREWMIHYYNAPMTENAWMRAEEERFLENIDAVFGRHRDVLHRVAADIGLEYFGIDATLDRDGRLFIFEADPAMVVHTHDPIELFPYKHRYIPRIFAAVERMADVRKPADN